MNQLRITELRITVMRNAIQANTVKQELKQRKKNTNFFSPCFVSPTTKSFVRNLPKGWAPAIQYDNLWILYLTMIIFCLFSRNIIKETIIFHYHKKTLEFQFSKYPFIYESGVIITYYFKLSKKCLFKNFWFVK